MQCPSLFLSGLASLLLALPDVAQDHIRSKLDDPEIGKYEQLPFPSKDHSYRKESEYVSLAKKALAQKMGPKYPTYDLDLAYALLRHYKEGPMAERDVIEVRSTVSVTQREPSSGIKCIRKRSGRSSWC